MSIQSDTKENNMNDFHVKFEVNMDGVILLEIERVSTGKRITLAIDDVETALAFYFSSTKIINLIKAEVEKSQLKTTRPPL